MTDVIAFSEALGRAGGTPRLLLGNGFSIAARGDIFRYDRLLDAATFDGLSVEPIELFNLLSTTDFERVIERLGTSSDLAELYGAGPDLSERFLRDAEAVREALAEVLAARHPDRPTDLTEAEYGSCRSFLSNFDRIYTLNYDMLLYWTLMHDDLGAQPLELPRNDGFGQGDAHDDYVVWDATGTFRDQRVFYVHGGLHLYDRGSELSKITFSRTGIPLVDQIRAALSEGRFPLIVTEGTADEKYSKILHNAYLNHAMRSFATIGGALFVYGHSLSANDQHLLDLIPRGRIEQLFVGLYGDPSSADNQTVVSAANLLQAQRGQRHALDLQFFDAASAQVWNRAPESDTS